MILTVLLLIREVRLSANNEINSGETEHDILKANLLMMNHENIFVFTEMQMLVGWT